MNYNRICLIDFARLNVRAYNPLRYLINCKKKSEQRPYISQVTLYIIHLSLASIIISLSVLQNQWHELVLKSGIARLREKLLNLC